MNLIKHRVAILIPIYKNHLDDDEWISLKNNIHKLKSKPIILIAPKKINKWLNENILNKFNNLDVIYFKDRHFTSVDKYNKLLMSNFFYRCFSNYEYILICQLDALIIQDKLDYWCGMGYSYIGAPWFVGFNSPKYPLELYGVGNGGLSLRKVDDYIKYLSKIRRIRNTEINLSQNSLILKFFKYLIHKFILIINRKPFLPRVNEDVFWGCLVAKQYKQFTVPKNIDALDFAFEVDPQGAYELNNNKLPFGCHAWQRYDKNFWIKKLGLKIE